MLEDYVPAHEYRSCYKCGLQITDNYPSHLCAECRRNLTAPSEKTLADRLTEDDLKFLMGLHIKIDSDMIKRS